MSQKFHAISEAQFDDVMADYDAERVDLDNVKEIVYDVPTDIDGLVVRVFSSIDTRGVGTKRARDSGSDAIRVLAYSKALDRPLAKATRTNRIETWESNLRPKIDDMLARANAGEFDTPDDDLAALEPADPDAENVVIVTDLFTNQYGDRRAVLDGDTYDAKEIIKFDWDTTHHDFDGDRKAWIVDLDAIGELHDRLTAGGFDLCLPPEDTIADEVAELVSNATRGDYITVTYEQKNGNGEAEKTGRVRSATERRISFDRDDDGHTMFVQVRPNEVALLTARSNYPYVGEVVDIAHVPADAN